MIIIYRLSKTLFWFHISNFFLLIILKIICLGQNLNNMLLLPSTRLKLKKKRNIHHTDLHNGHCLEVVLVCAWNCGGRCRWVVLSKGITVNYQFVNISGNLIEKCVWKWNWVQSKDEWPPHTVVNTLMNYAIQDVLKWEETISLNLKSSTESRRFGKRYRLKKCPEYISCRKKSLKPISEEDRGDIQHYIRGLFFFL